MAPADGSLVYHFGNMASAVEAIDGAVNSMRSTLSQLESDLRPLESGAWSSEAQQQYKIRKDRWHKSSEDIAVVLGKIRQSLEQAATNMRATDNKAKSYFDV